jgi:cytochrome c
MNTIKKIGLALGVTLLMGTGPALAEGDAANGEKLFKRCMTCHALEEGQNKVGPSLHNIIGRTAGTVEGYRYSNINQTAAEVGLVWTEDKIVEYLADPQAFLESYISEKGGEASGRTKMAFKLPKEEDRMDVVAYLKAQSSM